MLSEAQNTHCPWDPARLALIASTPEEERAIIAMLLTQGEQTLTSLNSLSDGHSQHEWQRAAHTLAGCAANLGMDTLLRHCRNAEALSLPSPDRMEFIAAIEQALQEIALYQPSSER